MNFEQFEDFASSGYNRIPVFRSVNIESSFEKLLVILAQQNRALLQYKDEKNHSISIFVLSATHHITYQHRQITVTKDNQIEKQFEIDTIPAVNPLDWLSDYISIFKSPKAEELPNFYGGLIGYLGSSLAEFTKAKANTMPGEEHPDFAFLFADDFLIIEHETNKAWLITYIDPIIQHAYDKANQKLTKLTNKLQQELSENTWPNDSGFAQFKTLYQAANVPAYFIHFEDYYLFGFGRNTLKKFRQTLSVSYHPETWPELAMDEAWEHHCKVTCQQHLSALCLHEDFHTDKQYIHGFLPPEFSAIDAIKANLPHPCQVKEFIQDAIEPNDIAHATPALLQFGLVGMLNWQDNFIGQYIFYAWLFDKVD